MTTNDPHNLSRFLDAQIDVYETALAEIRDGRKLTHWIWYIFPQYDGLGFSATSKFFAIKSRAEAESYLQHPILGPRLLECMVSALQVEGRTALEIFGSPDDLKLRSSATLFATISAAGSVFHQVIEKYFGGEMDSKSLGLMNQET